MDLEKLAIGGKEVIDHSDIEEVDEVSKRLAVMTENVNNIVIEDWDDYEDAADTLKQIKAVTALLESIAEKFRKPAYDYYKKVLDQKKKLVKPGENAEKKIKRLMSDFMRQKEEEKRKAIEAARRKAEEEAMKAAEELEEAGMDDAAEAILSGAENVAVEVQDDKPEVDNVTERSVWSAELVNLRELCAAVAKGEAPEDLVQLNSKEANALARSLKKNMNYPGIKAVEKKTIVVR